jgi:hypothetical protein
MNQRPHKFGVKLFSRKSALLMMSVGLILLWAVWYLVFGSLSAPGRVDNWGIGWIPAMSFSELEKSPPFVAVVESKMHSQRGVLVESSTGRLAPGARLRTYLMVYLRTPGGKRLGLCQEDPTAKQVALVSHLREGEEYSFPTILKEAE